MTLWGSHRRLNFPTSPVDIYISSGTACASLVEGSRDEIASIGSRRNTIHGQRRFGNNEWIFFEKCLGVWFWKHNNLRHGLRHRQRSSSVGSVISLTETIRWLYDVPSCQRRVRHIRKNASCRFFLFNLSTASFKSIHLSIEISKYLFTWRMKICCTENQDAWLS